MFVCAGLFMKNENIYGEKRDTFIDSIYRGFKVVKDFN